VASSILMKRRWLWPFEGWWPGLLTMIATSKGMRGLLLRESCTCTFMCALWWQKDWTCIPCLCVDSRQAHMTTPETPTAKCSSPFTNINIWKHVSHSEHLYVLCYYRWNLPFFIPVQWSPFFAEVFFIFLNA